MLFRSFIVVSLLGVPPARFGLLIACATIGYATTSLLTSRLVSQIGTTRLLTVGAWIAVVATTLMAALALTRTAALPVLGVYALWALTRRERGWTDRLALAAPALAAVLTGKYPIKGKTVAVVCSGGNVDTDVFVRALHSA